MKIIRERGKCMKGKIKLLLSMMLAVNVGSFPVAIHAAPESDTAQSLLNSILDVPPVYQALENKLTLPTIDNAQYEVKLAGSSNEAVIDQQGNVCTPLETMDVSLMYEVVNKEDPDDKAMQDDKDVSIQIPGKYEQEIGDNARPEVLPGIREWKGQQGVFTLTQDSRIVIANEELREAGENIAYYFSEMLGKEISVVVGEAKSGDIALALLDQKELGKEGYTIEIGDMVKVTAIDQLGALYAGTTLTQILSQDAQKQVLPKGFIRDYPAYEVRSAMLDVARFYMPIEYLEEVTKYMAYFKLNQLQVHLNDDGGEQAASFRLESKKFPAINSGLKAGEVYTQEQYKQYQKEVATFGIQIISEIDTPAHCRFVGLYDQSLMLDDSHIDLSNPNAVSFIQELYDEFLDGDDPVFQGDTFHIGADEYKRESKFAEDFLAYVDTMVKYINDKGLQPRMWASLGGGGITGTTPVDNRVEANYWAYSWADFPKMLKNGYPCINTSTDLYIVPGTSTGYEDYINLDKLYETWETYKLGGGTTISSAHPNLLGCQSALWYDRQVGMSQFDYFDRFRDQVMLISEKGWFGAKEDEQDAASFQQRIAKVDQMTPGSNPARAVVSNDETVVAYDFENDKEKTVQDNSSNGYDAQLQELSITEKDGRQVLALDGSGSLQLPFSSIGFPYTVSMDLFVEEETPENAVLFQGDDGVLYLNYQGSGCIGYERKGYQYIIDAPIETGRWQTIMLTCDNFGMNLYIDGVFITKAQYYNDRQTAPESSTFVLPTENIGPGVVGYLDNFRITNTFSSYEEMMGINTLDYRNVALHKAVEVSRLEVEGQWTGDMVVDGDDSTRVSLYPVDDAWLMVDLGESYLIDKVELDFNERPNKYQILVSENGEDWDVIHEDLACEGKTKGTDTVTLPAPRAVRYLKYQQLERFSLPAGGQYSGNFTEFKIFAYAGINALQDVKEEAETLMAATTVTDKNRAFLSRFQKNIELFTAALEKGTMEERCWIGKQMQAQIELLKAGDTTMPDTSITDLEALLSKEINRDYFDEETLQNYDALCKAARYTLIDLQADQAKINAAAKKLSTCLDQLNDNKIIVSANKDVYQDNYLANAVDKDLNTSAWLKSSQEIGDFIQFAFRYPFTLKNIHIIQKRTVSDLIEGADIEVSIDGENWTKLKEIEKAADLMIELPETETKYVRFVFTKAADHWTQIDEVIFNEASEVDTSALEEQLALSHEEEDYTPATYSVYKEAREAAERCMNNEQKTQAEVDQAVTKLKAAAEQLQLRADLTALQQLYNIAKTYEADAYTPASFASVSKELEAVKALLDDKNASQQQADEAYAKLDAAIHNLIERADYSSLQALITAIEAMDRDSYTSASVQRLETALTHAKDLCLDQNASQQQVIDEFILLMNARDQLVDHAVLQALQHLCKQAVDVVGSDEIKDVRPGKVQALHDAIATAQVLIEQQSEDVPMIEAATLQLYKALHELYKIVDKHQLEDFLTSIEDLHEKVYTPASWQKLLTEKEYATAIIADQDATKDQVQTAYDQLAKAVTELKLKVDKTALEEQLKIADKVIAQKDQYIASSVENLAAMIEQARKVFNKEEADQQEINVAATQLIQELAKARLKADKNGLETVLLEIKVMNMAMYTPESADLLHQQLQKANAVFQNEEASQADVDQAQRALQKAVAALVTKDQDKTQETPKTQTSVTQPGTGDTTQLFSWMLLLCGGALSMLLFRRKKQKNN